MALQVSERNAAIGATAAAGLPVAMSAGGIDVEQHLVDFADMIFEGDTGSASFVAGLGFSVLGAAAIAAAWLGPLNGGQGMIAMGLGVGFLGLAGQTFDVRRRI
ncbi:hypothetical protein GOC74_02115 [Halomicrobium mukohataei]|uniref:Uncharacterized protein n=1 Tax=Halomicrobium mukohataei TaxID=57705 RepID=A0A847TZI3_9EURY|nr:hypothetical protein [Halomicrobium mukohataei]NLV08733.1 hypothetical protein [Halomicrobium mukohataei]